MSRIPLIIEADPDEPGCGTVMIDGTVAGVPRRFILDTGAARTQLVADGEIVLERCGHDPETGGVFGVLGQALAIARDLRVGPIVVDELTVGVAEHPRARDLLGMDLLGRFCWRLSTAEGTLAPAGELSDPSAGELSIGPRGHPLLDLAWGSITARACWDTGASITVVDAGFVEAHPSLFTERSSSHGTDGSGATQETPTYLMDGPVIAPHRFRAHRVAVVDLSAMNQARARPIELILGYPLISQADWVMDFPARRWSATVVDVSR